MATYYVDGAVGDDANAGTSEGAGNAWATITKAMDTVAAGDTVYIKNSATYTETADISTVGTGASPIIFEGYSSTTGDGGIAVISGESTRAYGVESYTNGLANSNNFYIFRNIRITLCTSYGWYTGRAIRFENCHANANSMHGFYIGNYCSLIDCSAYSNSQRGVLAFYYCPFIRSKFYDNTYDGCYCYGPIFYLCEGYGNGNNYGQFYMGTNILAVVFNCTVDGENLANRHGFKSSSTGAASVSGIFLNNIIYDCATGIIGASSGTNNVGYAEYNLFNSNTTDISNMLASKGNDVTSAPSFTDEASHDYTLSASSPAINAGTDVAGDSPGMDMGAHQAADAGGGGLLQHGGMSGGANA